MASLLTAPAERARKAHSRVLQSLQEPGRQLAIAATLGISESTVSRLKNEKLEDVLAFVYACGFKLVSEDKVCVSEDALRFMRSVTSRAMAHEQMATQLFEEDE